MTLWSMSTLIGVLVASSGSGTADTGIVERVVTPYDDVVGFYESEGSRYRVTWRPAGGLYAIAIDPEHTTSRGGPTQFAITEDGFGRLEWDGRVVTVERRRGRLTALVATKDGTKPVRFLRLQVDPYTQHQVQWSSGEVRLVGTVMIPRGQGPHPGVALIQGAGTSGRNNLWAWTFADGLALRGIAALIPDKRGSGQSGGTWVDSDFTDLAADAKASLAVLRSFAQVDGARTGFVGLSQGGWVAPLAARRSGSAFCASLVSAFVKPQEQVRHELRQDFRRAGLVDSDVRLLDQAVRRFFNFVAGNAEWEHYARFADSLRKGATAELAANYLPADSTAPIVGFWRRIHDYDFPDIMTALTMPRLLVLGALDEMDNTPVGQSLARLARVVEEDPEIDLDIRLYSRLGHALGNEETSWVSPRVLDDLANWIRWRTHPVSSP